MIWIILLITVFIVGLILYLPAANGLATYKYEKKKRAPIEKQTESHSEGPEILGYIPPDQEAELRKQFNDGNADSVRARVTSLKEKIYIGSDDVPFKLHLSQEDQEGLRKRNKAKLDIDADPNNYDYDIDELIDEENENALEEREREFYKNDKIGKEREEMV